MSDVFNTETREILFSVNTPDYKAPWAVIINAREAIFIEQRYRTLSGSTVIVMDAAAKEAVDAPLLPSDQAYKINALTQQTAAYINAHYSEFTQRMLALVMGNAQSRGITARVDYIRRMVDWVESVLGHLYEQTDAVTAAAARAGVDAVALDLAQFDGTDPAVTIQEALATS